MRADLTAAERAKALKARKKAYQDAYPKTKRGGDRKSKAAKDQSAKSALRSFVDDTATKTGRSKRSIEQDVARAEAIGDDIDRVAGTSLDKGVELDALAAMRRQPRRCVPNLTLPTSIQLNGRL